MRLDGETVLITGGGRGIGAAVAKSFARAGANLALVSRTAHEVESVATACRALGVRAVALPADVACRGEMGRVASKAEKGLGPVSVLVNAAGVYGPIGPLVENSLDAWTQAVSVNLFGTLYALHAVLPGMIARRKGSVINFSGGGAVSPFPRFSSYATSKVAVVRLTETVAEEVREYGVRVNAIAPGAVNTRLLDEVLTAGERAGRDFYRKALEQKERGGVPPDRAAELALFLASPEAEGVTGRLISAVWDDWRAMARDLQGSSLYTLRRIDGRNFTEIPAVAAR